MLGMKARTAVHVAGDQGGGDVEQKLQNSQLFRVFAQGLWLVENAGALAFGLGQQMGGVEVLGIEGSLRISTASKPARARVAASMLVEPVIGRAGQGMRRAWA